MLLLARCPAQTRREVWLATRSPCRRNRPLLFISVRVSDERAAGDFSPAKPRRFRARRRRRLRSAARSLQLEFTGARSEKSRAHRAVGFAAVESDQHRQRIAVACAVAVILFQRFSVNSLELEIRDHSPARQWGMCRFLIELALDATGAAWRTNVVREIPSRAIPSSRRPAFDISRRG